MHTMHDMKQGWSSTLSSLQGQIGVRRGVVVRLSAFTMSEDVRVRYNPRGASPACCDSIRVTSLTIVEALKVTGRDDIESLQKRSYGENHESPE